MIILNILSSKLHTQTLLIYKTIFNNLFYFNIKIFKNFYIILTKQIFLTIFLTILLKININYFQNILPNFPKYTSTLFSNTIIIKQLNNNLLNNTINH